MTSSSCGKVYLREENIGVQRHQGAPHEAAARGGTLPAQTNGGARWVRSGRRRAWLGTYMRLVLAYSSCRSCALVPAGGSNRTSLEARCGHVWLASQGLF